MISPALSTVLPIFYGSADILARNLFYLKLRVRYVEVCILDHFDVFCPIRNHNVRIPFAVKCLLHVSYFEGFFSRKHDTRRSLPQAFQLKHDSIHKKRSFRLIDLLLFHTSEHIAHNEGLVFYLCPLRIIYSKHHKAATDTKEYTVENKDKGILGLQSDNKGNNRKDNTRNAQYKLIYKRIYQWWNHSDIFLHRSPSQRGHYTTLSLFCQRHLSSQHATFSAIHSLSHFICKNENNSKKALDSDTGICYDIRAGH